METKSQLTKFRFRKIILAVFFILISLRATAPGTKVVFIIAQDSVNAYARLMNAVIKVESAGDTLAYNPLEHATGAFQIRPIRLRDYNSRTGNNYELNDCYNLRISKEIFLYYAKQIGYPDYELIARNWNGSGKSTIDYWKKVRLNM
jgi:hypothetical protein